MKKCLSLTLCVLALTLLLCSCGKSGPKKINTLLNGTLCIDGTEYAVNGKPDKIVLKYNNMENAVYTICDNTVKVSFDTLSYTVNSSDDSTFIPLLLNKVLKTLCAPNSVSYTNAGGGNCFFTFSAYKYKVKGKIDKKGNITEFQIPKISLKYNFNT